MKKNILLFLLLFANSFCNTYQPNKEIIKNFSLFGLFGYASYYLNDALEKINRNLFQDEEFKNSYINYLQKGKDIYQSTSQAINDRYALASNRNLAKDSKFINFVHNITYTNYGSKICAAIAICYGYDLLKDIKKLKNRE
jgi:hypothetical protein